MYYIQNAPTRPKHNTNEMIRENKTREKIKRQIDIDRNL